MQAVPERWNEYLAISHRVEFKAVIGDGSSATTYTYSSIKSAQITKAMMDTLTIGQAPSAMLDMVFKPSGTIAKSAKISCFVRLTDYTPTVIITDELRNVIKTDDGYVLTASYTLGTDWIPFGTFYIDTREIGSDGFMTITAYDRMLSAEREFPSDAGSMTMSAAVTYIAGKIGVTVDSRTPALIAGYSIDSPVGVYTMREVLCGIAAASGGNFIITENNQLRLIRLASPGSNVSESPAHECDILGDTVTIGKVTLYPDDNTQYSSGSNGYEIQADCIYATQEICDSVKTKLNGATYLPFQANTAVLNPALELGDSVKINGHTSILASAVFTIGVGMSADIEAPIDTEINHEYPYQARTREERRTAASISKIEKDTENIRLSVEGIDVESSINVALNELTLSSTSKDGGASITLSKDGVSVTGDVTIGNISANKITSGTINANNVTITNLDADNISSGSISADHIKLGGDMTVYRSTTGNTAGGYIGYTTGSSGGSGIHMENGNSEVIVTNSGARMSYSSNELSVTSGGINAGCNIRCDGNIAPNSTDTYSLGYSNNRWSAIYAATGTVSTSDRKEKQGISYDLSKYDALFWRLKPASYRLKNGESGRTHTGMIAQDVEESLSECGLTGKDFAGFVKEENANGEFYGLRYEEFISLCIRQIQMLNERVQTLEEKLKNTEVGENG